MPAEQALAEARKRSGPSHGSGGGGHLAFRARLEESAAFLGPVALIGGLALAGGGYELSDRHVAGLVVWLVVVGLLVLGVASRAILARPFYWAAGLILGLAIWSALSSLWSGSVELSVAEADRVLVYLGVFLAAFLLAQTDQRRQRFGEGIGVAITGVVLLALATRLLPHVFSLSAEDTSGSRLFYPLHYWNANALFCAMAVPLLLWLSRRSLVGFLRPLAAGAIPPVVLTLYFTYSRGGILVIVVATACLLALSSDRLWMLGTVLIGAICSVPSLLYVGTHPSIGNFVPDGSLVGEGLVTLLLIAAGSGVAAALFLAQRRAEQKRGATVARALAISRDRRVLRGIGIATLVVLVVLGIAVGGRAWNKFSSADLGVTAAGTGHIGEVTSGGRVQFWEVALEAFGEKPLLGTGAGTYQFSWNQHRPLDMVVHNAHSLYLQPLAELGVVGGALVLGMVLFLLWVGFSAWRAASGRQRELYAVLLSVSLAFAVGSAFDWFWQIAGVGAVFFLTSGALVAARCAQIWHADGERPLRQRSALTVAGLAIAWLSMLALVGPLLVDYELTASNNAVVAGNPYNAVEHANTARSIEPWAASPYRQLGLLAEAQGVTAEERGDQAVAQSEYAEAIHRLDQAIARENNNWTLYFDRGRAEYRAGDEAAAQADLAEAKRLNPLEACLGEGFESC
jgi:O-Antigen ligase